MAVDTTRLASKIKKANERLRSLERANLDNSPSYKAVETMATDRRLYMGTTKNGEIKFRTDIKKLQQESPQSLKALEKQVDKFLKGKTSTLKGISRSYDKAFESAKKTTNKQGKKKEAFKGNKNDYLEMWGNSTFKKMAETFGSDEAVSMRNLAIDSGLSQEDFFKVIKDIDGKDLSTIEDDIIDAVIKQQKYKGRNAKKKKAEKREELEDKFKSKFESWLDNDEELPFD